METIEHKNLSNMSIVNVYKEGKLVDSLDASKAFLKGFHIYENPEIGLIWRLDEDPRESIRKRLRGEKPRGGNLIIWMNGRLIKWIPPNWDLWVNGRPCEKGSYRRFVIKWPKVELIYEPYRFEFLFPDLEGNYPGELPRPTRTGSNATF